MNVHEMNHKSDNGNGYTVHKKGYVDEIYHTKNYFIKYLAHRLQEKIAMLLDLINAFELKGIDVGTGEGHMLKFFRNKGVVDNIIGVDLNEERIQIARKENPDIIFLIEDIYQLDCHKEKYEYVLAIEILEHLPDPLKALEQLKNITKPNGYLIISVPHEPYFRIGNFIRGKHRQNKGKTPTHLFFWKKKEFERMIKEHVYIEKNFNFSVFPWIVYLCKFKNQ